MPDRTLVDARKIAAHMLAPGDIVADAPAPARTKGNVHLSCPAVVSSIEESWLTVRVRFTSGAIAYWPSHARMTVVDLVDPDSIDARAGQ